ncbi:hypothetical protein PC9H_007957 [Pleurotus ostreatus]|uniref:Wax synthase domain-containing protein n=1 Tax=Pleurotus ostreatus TaxID=5322 RepID=A0A8H6ZW99_PLEOS|nr:uncharacterized protein PC9H_007957 [Pleurotus ostreatus]KAF7428728.1 hypothetical protein PC9H_007957 [Pleurotus ostreatus]
MTGRVLSLLPYLITIFALSLPSPSFPLRLSLFLLILALTTHILTSTALPLASLNFSQGAALAAHVFAASDFLLLSHVHTDLKRNGQTGAWETMGQWERVRWAVSLVTSPRLIGWSSTSTSTPRPPPLHASPSPSTSTTSFILRQLLHLLLELLTLLAFITLSPSLPHLSASGPTLASAPYPLRLLYAPLLGLAMYASIDAPHRIWLLLLLCIGNPLIYVHNHASVSPLLLWTPADFQPLFGKWSDAYTVRRFWGRTWQQTHRRKFKSHSRFLKSLVCPVCPVCPPPSTNNTDKNEPLSRLLDLYTAFLVSGLMHAAGEYMMLASPTSLSSLSSSSLSLSSLSSGQIMGMGGGGGGGGGGGIWRVWGVRVGGSIKFFMIQALAVHVESIVLGVARAVLARPTTTLASAPAPSENAPAPPPPPPPPPPPRHIDPLTPPLPSPPPPPLIKLLKCLGYALGYIWVWHWFAYTAPVLFDPLLGAGFVDDLRGGLGG